MFAAHGTLAWPETAHGQLWHAVTLLREYRGDGHVVALVANELSGLDALVSHTASGIGFSVGFARRLRGWTEDEWAEGTDGLRLRGLLDAGGALTMQGAELRAQIEDLTDALAYVPWRGVSDDDAAEVATVAASIRKAVRSAGLFPGVAFGPRYGEHR